MREHGLKIGTIADLIEYRSRNESLIQAASAKRRPPPRRANSLCTAYRDRTRSRTWLTQRQLDAGDGCWCACTSRCRCSILLDTGAAAILAAAPSAGGDPG